MTEKILAFRDERDWAQFHTPRNLAAAIAIEAAELQQSLLWQSVVVTSGPTATHNPPTTLRWTTSYVWRNGGDPGRLLDANNVVRAESQ